MNTQFTMITIKIHRTDNNLVYYLLSYYIYSSLSKNIKKNLQLFIHQSLNVYDSI